MTIDKPENSDQTKTCAVCGSSTTYLDKSRWGFFPHWRYDSSGKPICGKRANWKKRLVPMGVTCDSCKTTEPTKTKYGTPKWAKNRDRKGGYLCWPCYITKINTGRNLSEDARKNLSAGIRRALDAGAIMGPKVHTMDETVFDTITEQSACWIGNLMADGNIYTGKTGNPRIALTLAEGDHEHLVKFRKFLNCSNEISPKKSRLKGKIWNQFTLRFTSKRLAGKLIAFGVTHRKSLTAKVIGLEDDKHFWRGVLDGDGHIKNKDGKDGDKVIVTGSYDLMRQFKNFIEHNIAGSAVRLKQDNKYYRLYIYSYTARMLLKLLYADCHIALDRKLAQARRMFYYIQ
jgi:hypothetical protein